MTSRRRSFLHASVLMLAGGCAWLVACKRSTDAADGGCGGGQVYDEKRQACVDPPRPVPSSQASAASAASALVSDALSAGAADGGLTNSEGEEDDAGASVDNARSVVTSLRGPLRSCYSAGLKTRPDLQGSVTLVAKVGPQGQVTSVSGGEGSSLEPIMKCLKDVVMNAKFAPPAAGGAVLSIPITFVQQK